MDMNETVENLLVQMFLQARAQFGNAIKSFWFYDGDPCPGCRGKVDYLKIKGENALSLNAFIYRKRGVLINSLDS